MADDGGRGQRTAREPSTTLHLETCRMLELRAAEADLGDEHFQFVKSATPWPPENDARSVAVRHDQSSIMDVSAIARPNSSQTTAFA